MGKLDFENKILEPVKNQLESNINIAMKAALDTGKTCVISLKMSIYCNDGIPYINFETGCKLKETKISEKHFIGGDQFEIIKTSEGNVFVKEKWEQEKMD